MSRARSLPVLIAVLAFAGAAAASVPANDSFSGSKGHVSIKHGAGDAVKMRFTGSLRGTVTGTMLKQTSLPDTGARFAIAGAGRVKPLGHVSVSGTAHGTGFIARGYESLNLTLSNAKHHVTVTAQSGLVPGFTSP